MHDRTSSTTSTADLRPPSLYNCTKTISQKVSSAYCKPFWHSNAKTCVCVCVCGGGGGGGGGTTLFYPGLDIRLNSSQMTKASTKNGVATAALLLSNASLLC